MRVWLFSDLHTELSRVEEPLPVPDADICICAGDTCIKGPASSVAFLGKHVSKKMPVVVVAGNRDYHWSSIVEGRREAFSWARAFPGVFFLDRTIAFIGGYRFVGVTLWGGAELAVTDRAALYFARRDEEDYRKIKMSQRPPRSLSRDTLKVLNHEDRDFLRTALSDTGAVPTVVVTHHAPSRLSILPQLLDEAGTTRNPGDFAREMVRKGPLMWVHGNLHNRSDYRVAKTRVICNPRGCRDRPVPGFDPGLVIDLARLRN